MTYEKTLGVTRYCGTLLGCHIVERGSACKLCPIKWMLNEMLSWDASRLEKMFRWLGSFREFFGVRKCLQLMK